MGYGDAVGFEILRLGQNRVTTTCYRDARTPSIYPRLRRLEASIIGAEMPALQRVEVQITWATSLPNNTDRTLLIKDGMPQLVDKGLLLIKFWAQRISVIWCLRFSFSFLHTLDLTLVAYG
jgi:hypothetical protein